MTLLLDTHALAWAESLDERLGPLAKQRLLDPANELRVSPVSRLELARLIALGRLSKRFARPLFSAVSQLATHWNSANMQMPGLPPPSRYFTR